MKNVFITVTVLTSLFVLNGCTSQNASPSEVAQEFCSAIHNDSLKKASEFTAGTKVLNFGIQTKLGKVISKAIFGRDSFSIINYSISGDKAIVKVEISSPNMGAVLPKLLQDGWTPGSGDHLTNNQLQQMLKDVDKSSLYSKEVKLNMVKSAGVWKVSDNNSEFKATATGANAPIKVK